MGVDRKVTGKKYRILTDKENKNWDVISFWTAASDVTVDSTGTTAEEEFSKLNEKIGAVDELTFPADPKNFPAYDSTKVYRKGDLVAYNGAVWCCTINMNAPEPWNPEHWKVVTSIPFRFGIDADGNYGYIKVGADSVTPFRQSISKKAYLGKGTTGSFSADEIAKICNENGIPMNQLTVDNFIFEPCGASIVGGSVEVWNNGSVVPRGASRSYNNGILNFDNGCYKTNTNAMIWVHGALRGEIEVADTRGGGQWYSYIDTEGELKTDISFAPGMFFGVCPETNIYIIY